MKYASLLVLSFLFLACGQAQKPDTSSTLMRISGTGKIEIAADQAGLTVYLKCTDMNLEKSRTCLLEQSEEFNSLLTKAGVAIEDLETTSLNMNKEYNWTSNGRKFIGYTSSLSTHVLFKDLKKMEKIYPQLLKEEKWSLSGLSYSHSKADSLKDAVYNLALDDANQLADQLMVKLGKTKRNIIQIANMQLSDNLPTIRANNNAEADDYYSYETLEKKVKYESSVSIHAGKMTFNQNLNIEYLIN